MKTRHFRRTAVAGASASISLAVWPLPPVTFANSMLKAPSAASTMNLHHIARSTWDYYVAATATPTGLPADRINIDVTSDTMSTSTNDTDIGMYMMSIVAAKDLGLINTTEAERRLRKMIAVLNKLPKYHGFFYDWYDTTTGQASKEFISTVDVAWLDAAFIVDRQAFPALNKPLTKLLTAMNFSLLYDSSLNQMYGGYTVNQGPTSFTFGNLNTETRIADYIAIGKGDVPATLWYGVYRTLPSSWTWQQQTPVGTTSTYDGVQVFEGHYTWHGTRFVPSWGGSMFESLMPTLFMDEQRLGTKALGLNDKTMVQLQIQYAKAKGYPVWGISPCALPNNNYGTFGIAAFGSANPPYEEDGTITPHASFLALPFAPQQALKNLSMLEQKYNMLGKYGFYDSVNVNTSAVTTSYLALDEGMTLGAIDNDLRNGAIRSYFNRDPIGKKPQNLLATEKFSI